MSPNRILAPGVVCAALLIGVAAPGVASAAGPTPSTVSARTRSHGHQFQKWLVAHRHQIRRAVLAVSAKAIGLSPEDLATDLRSGLSLADVADAHHVATGSVVAALLRAADAEVAKVAANGKLTSAQESKIKQKLETLVVQLVHHQFGQKSSRQFGQKASRTASPSAA